MWYGQPLQQMMNGDIANIEYTYLKLNSNMFNDFK